MKISAISANDNDRKNLFIQYANHFMSFKADPDASVPVSKPEIAQAKKIDKSMGIETLTIFPKQVINGKTIITA